MTSTTRIWGISLLFIAGLWAHAYSFMPYLADDALISLRYTQRFLDGLGLTWTDGRPVEGYSNFLWVILTAVPGALGLDLILSMRLLALLGMTGLIPVVVFWYLRQDSLPADAWAVAVGLLYYVFSIPIAVWSIGGLEQPLLVILMAGCVPLAFRVIEPGNMDLRPAIWLGVLLGCAALTRPDAPLYAVAIAVAYVLIRWREGMSAFRPLAVFVGISAFMYLAHVAFRYSYYGELVPNTALVKAQFTPEHFEFGLRYVFGGLQALSVMTALATLSLGLMLASAQRRARAIVLLSLLIIWLGYLTTVGGIFPAYRHLTPAIVFMTYACIEGAIILNEHRRRLAVPGWLAMIAVILSLPVFYWVQRTKQENRAPLAETFIWKGQSLGTALKNAFAEDRPLLAETAAGAVPYFSELPALDMLGLTDYYLPRNPPPNVGTGLPGHELGDGAYVLRQQPDIIVFTAGLRTVAGLSGAQMQETEEFFEQYSMSRLRATDPVDYTGYVWFKRYGGKIGSRINDDEIRVPAHLLNGNEDTVVYPDNNDQLVIDVSAEHPASVTVAGVADGEWLMTSPVCTNGSLTCTVTRAEDTLLIELMASGEEPVTVSELVLARNSVAVSEL